jgi:cellulose synthase/poly-beta-1,6-N-acetylglucosamine synthase-like glycosyltransferase
MVLFQILTAVLLSILMLNALYLLLFSAAGAAITVQPNFLKNAENQNNFIVIIPGYKEDAVIIDSVKSVLKQEYLKHRFKCVVLADGFNLSTIAHLEKIGAEVFVLPNDEKRNKAKSIQKYLAFNITNYDACLILDADNCIEPDFLEKANKYLNINVQVLQAKRVAKKAINSMSRLDELSEIINNHIFRKGQRANGFSASLIGSGMVFKMPVFEKMMENMDVFSGFDKELELRILQNKITIEYAEDIIVYDEKVSSNEVFVNQRRRWTYAQIYFLKKNFKKAWRELIFHKNADYFNKVLQFALLPRIVSLGLGIILLPIAGIINVGFLACSLAAIAMIVVALFIAAKEHITKNDLIALITKIPVAFAGMIKAILTSQRAAKKFIHTPHTA